MPCYHPLKAFIVGTNPETGKNKLKITSYETQYLIKYKNESRLVPVFESYCQKALNCGEKLCTYDDSCFVPKIYGYSRCLDGSYSCSVEKVFHKFFTIPCGQCIGCRIDYSKQWATRMLLENEYSSESWFVTLTYDDEHVPVHPVPNDDGEIIGKALSLCKRDFVLFNKRLREKFGTGIRFYACGEYGGKTMRPHYHSIYFNLHISDTKFHGMSPDGKFVYYESPTLAETWGKGFVLLAHVSFETCAYVARYVTKKFKGEKSQYESLNIENVFSLMSRKPGIGKQWFDDNWQKVYDSYIITVSSEKGGLRFKPPRYYDNLFDGLDSTRMTEIKENQVTKALNATRLKLEETDKSLLEMLADEERNFKASKPNLLHREEL